MVGVFLLTQSRVELRLVSELERRAGSTVAFLASRAELLSLTPATLVQNEQVKKAFDNDGGALTTRDALNHQFQAINKSVKGLAIYLLDIAGNAVATSNWNERGSFLGANFAFRPYFQDAIRDGKGLYVAQGVISKQMGIYVSRQVNVDGVVKGVIVVKYPLVLLGDSPPDSIGDDVYMIADSNGVIFDATDRRLLLHALAELPTRTVDHIRRNKQYGDAELPSLRITNRVAMGRGERVDFAFPPRKGEVFGNQVATPLAHTLEVPGTGWRVMAMTDGSISHAECIRNTLIALLIYLLLFGLFLAARQRKHFLEKAYQSAIRDPLTGLFTRLYANDAIPRLMRSHDERGISELAAILYDIDHFKQVNDVHGHAVGDMVLKEIGDLLIKETRPSDLPIRLGGEELAVVMETGDIKTASEVAERVRRKVENLRFPFNKDLRITISGGVVMREPNEDMAAFLHRGDELLYQAKKEGRNRIISATVKPAKVVPLNIVTDS